MKNWAPLIVVLALLVLLAVLFGPGLYRGWLLRQSIGGMLESVRAGRTADLVAQIKPSQQQQAAQLFADYLPADYQQRIESLKLSRLSGEGNDTAVAIVTCKLQQGGMPAIYQGQLVWHYTQGQWQWDFLASGGAEFSPSGEPAWIRLSDLIPLAESL